MKGLYNNIEKLIKDIDGYVAAYIKDIDSGEIIRLNDEERFHSASIIKIPIL